MDRLPPLPRKYNQPLISIENTDKINELITEGWRFSLSYGDHGTWTDIKEPCWEADFTRKKANGFWDNHESGYDKSPDVAITIAYYNIKNGIKLRS